MWLSTLSQLLLAISPVQALWEETEKWRQFVDGSDLQNFISRPEIKAPRWEVTKLRPEAIAPGFWFVAPQGPLLQRVYYANQRAYAPCVIGPLIYDGDGELIWSGACKYDSRVSMNFRPVQMGGAELLSFYVAASPPSEEEPEQTPRAGILINNQYEEISRTTIDEKYAQDEHEFKVLPSNKTGLFAVRQRLDVDASVLGQQGTRRISVFGFQEVKLDTNELLFNWNPLEHGVLLNESCDTEGMKAPSITGHVGVWDYFHLNSVEKFKNGDYLISARHTSTVYRVSGGDGHVVWRLGGCHGNSDFVMDDDVPFFWQHNAEICFENATHIIVSLFDNESEFDDIGEPSGHNPPVGKVIVLNTASNPMTANLLRRFDRPDKGQTPAEGGMTVLGAENAQSGADIARYPVLINWAFEGYISEYDGNNELVLEARFVSDRLRNYRAFKAPWVGHPKEPPALKVLPIKYSQTGLATASAFYVSWNGATEVRSWRFYGRDEEDEAFRVLATVDKRGFETSWLTTEVVNLAYAEALDVNGEILGKSGTEMIALAQLDPKSKPASSAFEETKSAHMVSFTGSSSRSTGTEALEAASYVVIVGFAVFGVYTASQDLWRRRGHMVLPTSRGGKVS